MSTETIERTETVTEDEFAYPEVLGTSESHALLVGAAELGAVLRAAYTPSAHLDVIDGSWTMTVPVAGITSTAATIEALRHRVVADVRAFVADNDVTHPFAWAVKTSTDAELADWFGATLRHRAGE